MPKYPMRHIAQNKCWSILSSFWVAQIEPGQMNLYSQQELIVCVCGGNCYLIGMLFPN